MQKRQKNQYFQWFPTLKNTQSAYRTMCFRLVDTKPFHQPSQLLRRNVFNLVFVPRPLKLSVFQPLVQEYKSIAFPAECFDAVAPSAAEQKQAA
ncbi:MAG: hypothetical protein JL50_01830 [Peptococcaceae bacterium BICA1-7]|nr:MAG: hypothetical protein JL50_01830 [Peptococcaceae bacterium BICA1-7]